MNETKRPSTLVFALALLALCAAAVNAAPWVQAYYTGWQQDKMAPSQIDFAGITQLVHFSVIPNDDGTLDRKTNGLTDANVKAAVAAAHAAGRRILFTVGGYPSQAQFESAMSPAHEADFIANLVSFLKANHYDGVDLDMEPMSTEDGPRLERFVADLRAKLDAIAPRPLLTTTALWAPAAVGRIAKDVDEVNLMTYALSGPYAGWMAWHNAPLYGKGYKFPAGGAPPSADVLVAKFVAAGVPKSKVGIGFSMDPYVWTGVSEPGETWGGVPPTVKESAYDKIADEYGITEGVYTDPRYRWDANAQAPYLSIAEGKTKKFISYDNEVSARAKADYIKANGLGGLVVWDLQDGYRAKQPVGRQQVLMDAIRDALLGSDVPTMILPTPTVPIKPLPTPVRAP